MVLTTSASILSLLQIHGYWIMFALMFIEGPMVTYIAAFIASLGIFNFYYVLILSILGNSLPDLTYFLIGRIGKHEKIRKYAGSLLDKNRIIKIREHLKNHPWKTILVIKLTPALPFPGFILSGTTDLKLTKFIFCSLIISAVYSVFFSFLGFYSGLTFNTLSKYIKYGEILIVILVLLTITIWLLFKFLSQRVSKRIEKI
ncbi:MAG: VTT domain-containing protein [Candidatus Pacearchaeota archaeon]|jgi:membrane protein DedA with SNARE-associated domain